MVSLAYKGWSNWGTLFMFRSLTFFCLIRLITVYRSGNSSLMEFKYTAIVIKMSLAHLAKAGAWKHPFIRTRGSTLYDEYQGSQSTIGCWRQHHSLRFFKLLSPLLASLNLMLES